MSIKICKTAMCVSALFAAAVWSRGAFAAVSEDFEGGSVDATKFALGTAGSIVAGGPTSPVAGYPKNDSSHTKVLAVTGTVTYTDSPTPSQVGASQVDFMFKAEPTDELDLITDNTVKVALAVGPAADGAAKVPVSFWCKAKDQSTNSWVTLCSVNNGEWARATLVLDYANNRCRVSIDGDPQITDAAAVDAWYEFVNTNAENEKYLKSITMIGATEVDDFVVNHTALDSYSEPFAGTAATAGDVAITYNDLNKYGITKLQASENADVSDGAGMKISEKIEAGLNPKSATKFEMQAMTTTAGSVTVKFPGAKGNGGYRLKVGTTKGGNDVVEGVDSTQVSASGEGLNEATATIPPADQDKLLYFTVETK